VTIILRNKVTKTVVQKCDVAVEIGSDSVQQSASICPEFVMPSLGLWEAVASSADQFGTNVEAAVELGIDPAKINEEFITEMYRYNWNVKSTVKPGEQTSLSFYNVLPASNLLVMWSSSPKEYKIHKLNQGFVSLKLDVPADCTSACTVWTMLAAPRQASSFSPLPAELPTSSMFDPRAPAFESRSFTVRIETEQQEDGSLSVAIAAPATTTPSSTVTIKVSTNSKQTGSKDKTEIAAFIVDTSYLEAYPHPRIEELASVSQSDPYVWSQQKSTTSALINKRGYSMAASRMVSLGQNDTFLSWSQYSFPTSRSYSKTFIDQTEDEFWATRGYLLADGQTSYGNVMEDSYKRTPDYSEPVQYDNFYGGGGYGGGFEQPMMFSAAPMAMAAEMDTAYAAAPSSMATKGVAVTARAEVGAPAAGGKPGVRSKFEPVPLVISSLVTSEDGTTSFDFKAPDNIGTFVIRVYAFDGERFGSSESEIVSSKKVSLQAMLPRLARVSDKFDAGVTVASQDPSFKGSVTVSAYVVSGGFELVGDKIQTVTVSGTTPVQVYFQFDTAFIGAENKVRFSATLLDDASDAMEGSFPVLGLQDEVFVATSMAITANTAGEPWAEAVSLPGHVKGSGRLEISAGVGRYPAVVDLTTRIHERFEQDDVRYPPNSDTYLARVSADTALHKYTKGNPEVVDFAEQISGMADKAILVLSQRTNVRPLMGLQHCDPKWQYCNPRYVDVHTNTRGLYMKFRRSLVKPTALTRTIKQKDIVDAKPEPEVEELLPVGVEELLPFGGAGFPSVRPVGNDQGMMLGGRRRLAQFDPRPMPMPMPMPMPSQPKAPAPGPSANERVDANDITTLGELGDQWFSALNSLNTENKDATNYHFWTDEELSELILAEGPFVRLSNEYAKSRMPTCRDSFPLCWSVLKDCSNPQTVTSCPLMCGSCTPEKETGFYPVVNLLAKRKELSLRSRVQLALSFLLRPGLPLTLIFKGNWLAPRKLAELKSISKNMFSDSIANIKETVQLIMNNVRVQGRTAYIAAYEGAKSAADMELQSLALEVLSLNSESRRNANPLIEKIANYVSSSASSGGAIYPWSSHWSYAMVTTSLGTYDGVRKTLSPAISLEVKAGSSNLLAGQFDSPVSPIVSSVTNKIPTEKITFVASGKGEVSVSIGAAFIPNNISPDPVYRGIYLEKSVKRVHFTNRSSYGEGLSIVERGALLSITLQLTTPDDLNDVTLTDLLPGGLEPEQPQRQAPADPFQPVPSGRYQFYGGRAEFAPICWWGYCNPFGSPTITSDRITWKASFLSAGSHSVSYFVFANTPGVWNLPPAKASVDLQPEVMGLSAGGKFVVSRDKIPEEQQAVFLREKNVEVAVAMIPRDCPTCGVTEQCDVRTGSCIEAAPF